MMPFSTVRAHAIAVLLVIAGSSAVEGQQLPTVPLRAGMVITRSVRLAPGTYRLPAPALADSAVITIRGDGITVDLIGVTLLGSDPSVDPDQRTGLAILIDHGHRVTVKNGRIHGYQTAIRAVGTVDLTLLNNDLGQNWRPRLFSIVGHESLVDWLSFHHNEAGEWRRFGAGIALEGVHRGTVRGNTVRQGMNGLLLTRTDSLRIDHNEFSFNSGLGIGLYRSSGNTIVRNRVDYNVRGFSDGYYRRGQDSADLLVFEQSSHNIVAFNAMTHGGDGLFLWAGQQTMDSGEGGSNDNLFLGNDFSWAPTNAMEATFSRNDFVANRVVGSDHGLWGGYSYGSRVVGNCFAQNRVGIAVEHGQDNTVAANSFTGDSTAIQLWADSITASDWGYPKHRDTRSRNWSLEGNDYRRSRVGLRIRQTTGLTQGRDLFSGVDTVALMSDTAQITLGYRAEPAAPRAAACLALPPIPAAWKGRAPVTDSAVPPLSWPARFDRSAIIVDEWGPYDWSTPKIWPLDTTPYGRIPLRILGPIGAWHVRDLRGIVAMTDAAGHFGDTVVITPAADSPRDWHLELEDAAGHRFSYDRYEPIALWNTRYYAWTDSTSWTTTPILSRREPRLDLMWFRPIIAGIPRDHWALEATGSVDIEGGLSTLRTISNDAIQVWVDGKLAIDHWTPHESLVDAVAIAPGHHDLRVRYLHMDGWVELRVEIVRGHQFSTGSPGPH